MGPSPIPSQPGLYTQSLNPFILNATHSLSSPFHCRSSLLPAMSLFLRAFPLIALRSKPFPLCRTIFKLNPKLLSHRTVSYASSASSTETQISDPKPSVLLKDTLQWVSRTRFCGELSVDDVGKRVRLCGWVALHRVHGGLTFLNLRDHTGTVQVSPLFYVLNSIAFAQFIYLGHEN